EISRFININLPVFALLLGFYTNLNFKRLIELRFLRACAAHFKFKQKLN
ncbi:MAG: hypothetical protein ACI9NN_002050, partial [Bacteroidia bacterium]